MRGGIVEEINDKAEASSSGAEAGCEACGEHGATCACENAEKCVCGDKASCSCPNCSTK